MEGGKYRAKIDLLAVLIVRAVALLKLKTIPSINFCCFAAVNCLFTPQVHDSLKAPLLFHH
jgi:hypothetical protein